eukprot:11870793-Alexandrium_andersonii.AAC.1
MLSPRQDYGAFLGVHVDASGCYPVPEEWLGPSDEHHAFLREFEEVVDDPLLSPMPTSGDRNGCWKPVDPQISPKSWQQPLVPDRRRRARSGVR